MTGFRSGASGSLIRRAKAAGRAIGKRIVSGVSRHSLPARLSFSVPPLRAQPSLCVVHCKTHAPQPVTPRRIKAHKSTSPPLNPEPLRPRSLIAEMWKDYPFYKAAGMLSEWRKKWAEIYPHQPENPFL